MKLHCNNKIAISTVQNPAQHGMAKHIEINTLYI